MTSHQMRALLSSANALCLSKSALNRITWTTGLITRCSSLMKLAKRVNLYPDSLTYQWDSFSWVTKTPSSTKMVQKRRRRQPLANSLKLRKNKRWTTALLKKEQPVRLRASRWQSDQAKLTNSSLIPLSTRFSSFLKSPKLAQTLAKALKC